MSMIRLIPIATILAKTDKEHQLFTVRNDRNIAWLNVILKTILCSNAFLPPLLLIANSNIPRAKNGCIHDLGIEFTRLVRRMNLHIPKRHDLSSLIMAEQRDVAHISATVIIFVMFMISLF